MAGCIAPTRHRTTGLDTAIRAKNGDSGVPIWDTTPQILFEAEAAYYDDDRRCVSSSKGNLKVTRIRPLFPCEAVAYDPREKILNDWRRDPTG